MKTWLSTALALLISALIILAAMVWDSQPGLFKQFDRKQPFEILGKSMRAVVGSAQSQGEQLVLTEYQPKGSEYHAIVVWRGLQDTADYPLIRYQVDTLFPGPVLKLIWRTSSSPAELYTAELNRTDGQASWQDMSRNPDWQGNLIEVGLYIVANSADQALSISSLTLEPLGWRGALASLRSDWTGFRGWTTSSINYLYGTVDSSAPSPLVAAAAWAGLAAILLAIVGLVWGGVQPAAWAVVVLVPWISLDMLWQAELSTQLQQTREQFAGKSVHDKHLADIDSNIYRYITRLKDNELPSGPSRIVILHKDRGHNYERLKAQFYLLPNNVYNLSNNLHGVNASNTDYILVLGDVPGIRFLPEKRLLTGQGEKERLLVQVSDTDVMGTLYRVQSEPAGKEGKHD